MPSLFLFTKLLPLFAPQLHTSQNSPIPPISPMFPHFHPFFLLATRARGFWSLHESTVMHCTALHCYVLLRSTLQAGRAHSCSASGWRLCQQGCGVIRTISLGRKPLPGMLVYACSVTRIPFPGFRLFSFGGSTPPPLPCAFAVH